MKGNLGSKAHFHLPTFANFLKTQSGKFLSELMENGSAQVQIRANYLGSIFSFSESLFVPCPTILSQENQVSENVLQIYLNISHFQDKCLWVSLWEISRKQKVPLNGSTDWFFADVTQSWDNRFNAQILLNLGDSGLSKNHDFFPYLSLVPDPLGILNRAKGPKDGPYPGTGEGVDSPVASNFPFTVQEDVSDQLKAPSFPNF